MAGVYGPETGLYYYRSRYYSAALGRFMQNDTIGYDGGINLYAYVMNDPVNGVDPSGECFNCFTAAVGATAGAVTGLVVQGATDYISGTDVSFDRETFARYSSATIGGASAGAVFGFTGNYALAGAAGEAASNLAGSLVLGTPDPAGFVADTLTGAFTGGAMRYVPGLSVSGITSGRNSFAAVASSVQTKLNNGTISSFSSSTFGKAVAADITEDAYRTMFEQFVDVSNPFVDVSDSELFRIGPLK